MIRENIVACYDWQFSVGRGIDNNVPNSWLPALAELCKSVSAAVTLHDRGAFYWLDIKEKHGQLAVDYVAPDYLAEEIERLIVSATVKISQQPPKGDVARRYPQLD